MLKLNSVTLKDDETGKIIEVNIKGSITSAQEYTSDERTTACLFAGIVIGAGLRALNEFIEE